MVRTFTILVVLLVTTQVALADSWIPFRNFRQVDPTGRYYVIFKELPGGPEDPGRGTPVSFELAERKPGSKPVFDAEDFWKGDEVVGNPDVKVREGDLVHGRGKLERCPREVLISSNGSGFVGLDVRGYNYGHLRSGNALVIVAKDGAVRHGLNLIDLFREDDVENFQHTAGGVDWLGAGWIDDRRGQVIVVSTNRGNADERIDRLFRIVNLQTGKVRPGSPDEILTALVEANPGGLAMALELAAELKLKHMALPAILDNERLPLAARVRAAVALAASGDKRGAELLRKAALDNSPAQAFAVRNLPLVLDAKAAAVLCDVVRRFGNEHSHVAWVAMHGVSAEAAVPELLKLLSDEACPDAQDFVLECLSTIGPDASAAKPAIKKLLSENPKTKSPEWTEKLARMALKAIEQ